MDIVSYILIALFFGCLSIIINKLSAIVSELKHLRNSTWKQHTLESEQNKKEFNAVKKSVWGSSEKKTS